ncbi:MAG: NYN domain-containing protein, partial [Actinomycetota bacterium]|nr:NYN domain-containing protein [Actinomycetota bacterium]
ELLTVEYYIKEGVERTKGNVDAELVLYAMIEYPNYDKAIIVSGDGDFHCLIEYLEKKGKLLHLLIPNPKKYSALLRKFHKYFIYINQLEKKLGKKKRGSNLRTEP